jgi:hypothetical protein
MTTSNYIYPVLRWARRARLLNSWIVGSGIWLDDRFWQDEAEWFDD